MQKKTVSLSISVTVRVTLKDGTYHEVSSAEIHFKFFSGSTKIQAQDIGCGSVSNAKDKAKAYEKAKKEGTTDGVKRALRYMGNALGLCVYDVEYLKRIKTVKSQPVSYRIDECLHT